MANRVIEKEKIDGKQVLKEIKDAGFSIRSFARAIKCGDRTLRAYLEKNEMPEYLLKKVYTKLSENSPTLWVRIGFTVHLPREKVREYIDQSKNDHQMIYGYPGYADVELMKNEVRELMKYATLDGDSYIPATCIEDTERDWFNRWEELDYVR